MSAEGCAADLWEAWLDGVERALDADATTALLPEPGALPRLPEALAPRADAVRGRIDARAARLRAERDAAAAELARIGSASAGAPVAAAPAFLDTTA
ncbi:hypothetical protein ACWKWP_16300 [Agromyces soli]